MVSGGLCLLEARMGEPAKRVSTKLGKAYEVEGMLLPSVTTVLRQMSAPALEAWKRKQLAQAAIDLHEWRDMPAEAAMDMLLAAGNAFGQRAAATGTEIHELLEQGVEPGAAPERVQPYMWAAMAALQKIGAPEPVAAERTVVNLGHEGWGGYAGTADLFYSAEGGLGVLDWKSKADPGSTAGWSNDALQLAALAACDTWMDREGELHPMEDEVVEITIAAIKSDGTADVRRISAPDTLSQLTEAFRGLVHVHELMAQNPWWMGIWEETYEGISYE